MPLVERRLFTVDEYYRMAKAGILTADDRVELIEGEIVRMSPIGNRHASCVGRLNRLFTRAVGDRAFVQVQNPVRLSAHSEPEPDVMLLKPRQDFYSTSHPGPADVLLLVEVADDSLDHDRDVKKKLYAEAGIAEYWIVDLVNDRIEVYRKPSGSDYADSRTLGLADSIAPEVLPDVIVPVREVIP